MKKILIGEISSYKALVIAKYLKRYYSDIKLYAYDYNKKIKSLHTKFCDFFVFVPNPKIDPKNHLEYLRKIIDDKDVDLFIPVHSDMYGEYIKNKRLFGRTFDYIGEYEQFYLLHDKEKFNNLLITLDIKRPKVFNSFDDAIVPFIFKPTNMSAAKGVKYVLTEKDRIRYRNQFEEDFIIQEYVSGIGCGYSVYAADGNILVGCGHKRLSEYPISGGSSVYRENYDDSRMEKVASKVLKAVKWTGFAMFEFKLTADNELYLIEVNPRIWGSINQGLQNGINYFEPILGKAHFNINTAEKKTFFSPFIYGVLITYVFNGNFKPLITFIRNIKYNRADVSFLNDPKGWLSLVLRKIL